VVSALKWLFAFRRLRLSKALGRSPESWLSMQDAYDLWQAKKRIKLGSIQKINLNAA